MSNQPQLTKVTFEFANGKTQAFEATGFVGAFIAQESPRGAQLGAFATGKFNQQNIVGLATAVNEAISKEMLNQGFTPHDVANILSQIVPHSVESATIREVDESLDSLLSLAPAEVRAAIEALLGMTR